MSFPFAKWALLLLSMTAVTMGPAQAQRPSLKPPMPQAGPMPPAWNAAEVIRLWRDPPGGGFKPTFDTAKIPAPFRSRMTYNIADPTLRVFRPAKPNGRALLVVPGGGYVIVAIDQEGLKIAEPMTARGYTVFVLSYRLPQEGWTGQPDVPLQDAQRAMRLIRSRAASFGIDPAKIAAVGFSAGGHLAATLATRFDEPVYPPRDAADRMSARPDAAALIYPVITMSGPERWSGVANLLGPNPPADLVKRRSPELNAGPATPPLFIVHPLDDTVVPVANGILMFQAMRAAKRPVEAHFFEEGGHGFGPGDPALSSGHWLDLFTSWLDRAFAGTTGDSSRARGAPNQPG